MTTQSDRAVVDVFAKLAKRGDPDDPFPDLVESVCVNVCGRDESLDARFVPWLRKFLTTKLASAQAEHATWRQRAEAAERDLAALRTDSERLTRERDQARKAINDYGSNPNGFDWAVLGKIDELESANERLTRERDELSECFDAACDGETAELIKSLRAELTALRKLDFAVRAEREARKSYDESLDAFNRLREASLAVDAALATTGTGIVAREWERFKRMEKQRPERKLFETV